METNWSFAHRQNTLGSFLTLSLAGNFRLKQNAIYLSISEGNLLVVLGLNTQSYAVDAHSHNKTFTHIMQLWCGGLELNSKLQDSNWNTCSDWLACVLPVR